VGWTRALAHQQLGTCSAAKKRGLGKGGSKKRDSVFAGRRRRLEELLEAEKNIEEHHKPRAPSRIKEYSFEPSTGALFNIP